MHSNLPPPKSCPKVLERFKSRNQSGSFLVEAIVSVLVSSIFAAAIVTGMSQGLSLTSGSHNQVIAGAMCQEVLDAARSMNFVTLASYAGTWPLTVQLTGGTINANQPYPRALLIDQVNYLYGAGTDAATLNSLTAANCTATEVITAPVGVFPYRTVTVTVTVQWRDSTTGANWRTYTASTVVGESGLGG